MTLGDNMPISLSGSVSTGINGTESIDFIPTNASSTNMKSIRVKSSFMSRLSAQVVQYSGGWMQCKRECLFFGVNNLY